MGEGEGRRGEREGEEGELREGSVGGRMVWLASFTYSQQHHMAILQLPSGKHYQVTKGHVYGQFICYFIHRQPTCPVITLSLSLVQSCKLLRFCLKLVQ